MSNQNHPIQHLLFAMDILPLDGEHIRNNNNQNTLWQLRDRLFQVLFERATVAYATAFPCCFRKFLEIVFLFFAVISLFTLAYIHVAFVQVPVDCLENETQTWSREGVLRVEISVEQSSSGTVDISKYCNEATPHIKKSSGIQSSEKHSVHIVEKPSTLTIEIHKDDTAVGATEDVILDAEKSPEFINRTLPYKDSVHDPDCLSPLKTVLSDMEMFTNTVWTQNEYIIEYSLEYGFLRLSPGARQNTSVKVHTVTLDPKKDQCFGNKFSKFLLKYVVGYGDVLMSSLRYLVDKDENKGFVRNVVTGDQYRFVDKSTTWTAYFSAAFIMMVFTLSISMLLRYSHHQIFMFIVELLHVFEFNTSVSFPAAPLLTVVLALVGMEAIMSEFFNDSSTAFYIILIVWIADQYDTICCHTSITKRHWLRFFYLYHFAFYAYHYRFNGQYSTLALATSWFFIQHSMLYFFHRYELPAVLQDDEDEAEIEPAGDDASHIDNDAVIVIPDTDFSPENAVSSAPNQDNIASQEQHANSSNANMSQDSDSSSLNTPTLVSENAKTNILHTEQSSVQERRSSLVL